MTRYYATAVFSRCSFGMSSHPAELSAGTWQAGNTEQSKKDLHRVPEKEPATLLGSALVTESRGTQYEGYPHPLSHTCSCLLGCKTNRKLGKPSLPKS